MPYDMGRAARIDDGGVSAGDTTPMEEQREVMGWLAQIEAAERGDAGHYENVRYWRDVVAGDTDAAGDPGLQSVIVDSNDNPLPASGTARKPTGTNLILSTIEAALPQIYQDEDLTVRPAESTNRAHYEFVRNFGRTLELVLRHYLVDEAELDDRMEDVILATLPEAIGWLKVGWYREYETEPELKHRREDVQDELARLRALTSELEGATDPARKAMLASELAALREALFAQVEVEVASGIALDRIDAEDMVVDPGVGEIARDWRQARWMAQGGWYTMGEARERFGLTDEEAKRVEVFELTKRGGAVAKPALRPDSARTGAPNIADGPSGTETTDLVRWYEIWDRVTHRRLTVVKGLKRWAREPHVPESQPEQWFPFYPLAFTRIAGRRYPLSIVSLLERIQTHYRQTRERWQEHRDNSAPVVVMDATRVNATEAKKFERVRVGGKVAMEIDRQPGESIANAFFESRGVAPDPRLYDVTPYKVDLMDMSGLGDAQRGGVNRPKTATEARQVQAGVDSRGGRKASQARSLAMRIARDVAEILLLVLDEQEVARIAGADYVWPELDRREIYEMVSVEIEPNGPADKEQRFQRWMAVEPMIMQTQMQVAELRVQGQEWLVAPLVARLEETLERADVRVEIERFLPGGPVLPGQPPPPQLQEMAARGVSPFAGRTLMELMGMAPTPGGPGMGAGRPPGPPGAAPGGPGVGGGMPAAPGPEGGGGPSADVPGGMPGAGMG